MSALIILVKMKTNITLAKKKEIEAKNDIIKKKKKHTILYIDFIYTTCHWVFSLNFLHSSFFFFFSIE